MIIDLRAVFSGKTKELPIATEFDFKELELNGNKPISSLVCFTGKIVNVAEIVTLKGNITFSYTAPCDRCAVETTKDFDIPVNHIIVNTLENENEDDFIVSENMELDLDDLIRTDIILGLPYLFLCKDDCKGVCSGCGKNLNTDKCVCEKEIDERFAKLSEFFE